MGRVRALGAILGVALLAVGLFAGATAATAMDDPRPGLTVELEPNGDALLTLSLAFDLDDDADREAFEELRADEDAAAEAADRFEDRLEAVAADVGTPDAVQGATVTTDASDDGTVGVVHLSVEWRALASADGDRLTLTEPFASGFEPTERLTIVAPDGYELVDATPEPNEVSGASTTWDGGTDLTGLEASYEHSSDDAGVTDGEANGEPGPADESTPGFGLVAALGGLLGAVLLGRRFRGR